MFNFEPMRISSLSGKFLLVCALGLLLPFAVSGQAAPAAVAKADTSRKIIQFSGLVVDGDSLNALPFVAIVIRNSERGVYSNMNGYYSIVVEERDTVDFYALGYRRASFVLPDTFTTNAYNHVQTLRIDTILLRTAVIYPWPSKDRFKDAFLNMDVPTDDLDRARLNLAQAEMVQAAQSVAMDGNMAASSTLQRNVARNYYAGQLQPNNLLNPVAWSRFLQSLGTGQYKRQ
jgi:hypothetical protein